MSIGRFATSFARLPRRTAPVLRLARLAFLASLMGLAVSLWSTPAVRAQSWDARYNGPGNGQDRVFALAVDASGNVYVTGSSNGGTATNSDYATIKYTASGVQQWIRRYNGPNNSIDSANAIAVDASGNVYVTGQSFRLFAPPEIISDYATIKYNASGVQQWVQRYNGAGDGVDAPSAISVDASGKVYVTGYSYGGTASQYDYATIKYDSAGVQQWAQRYNGPANADDRAKAVAVDASGNVYVTGFSNGGSASNDYATIKYNSAGVQQWAQRYNGPSNDFDQANALVVDASGNVYVTGESGGGNATAYDYATIKYNSVGVQQWAQRYNGPGDYDDTARAIVVDASGNVYVTGNSDDGISDDYATVKYNSAGLPQWVARYNGPANGSDVANAVAVDAGGSVYVAGYSYGGSVTGNDYATVRYNSAGVPQWAQRYNGPANGSDLAYAVAVDAGGNVYVAGYSNGGSGTGDDYATIKYAAPRWTPADVAVNRTDNTTRLLWQENATKRYALWKVSATGAVQTGKYYGPLAGYTCEEIAVAPNGQTTLLWKNPTAKKAALWTIAADLSSIVKTTTFNYPSGYTPSYLAADKDNNLRLTWRKITGAVAFWTITPANGAIVKSTIYGPYTNLVDGPLAVGADGVIRFAWRNAVTGGATLWTIPSGYGAPISGYNYTIPGAVPGDMGVGNDNKTRLQWAYPDGKVALWKVNTTVGGTGSVESGKFYGPLADVSPLGLSVGGDNQARQLWAYTNGKAALWVLNDPLTSITTAYTYGPIP